MFYDHHAGGRRRQGCLEPSRGASGDGAVPPVLPHVSPSGALSHAGRAVVFGSAAWGALADAVKRGDVAQRTPQRAPVGSSGGALARWGLLGIHIPWRCPSRCAHRDNLPNNRSRCASDRPNKVSSRLDDLSRIVRAGAGLRRGIRRRDIYHGRVGRRRQRRGRLWLSRASRRQACLAVR